METAPLNARTCLFFHQAGAPGPTGATATTRACSTAADTAARIRRQNPASARATSLSPENVVLTRCPVSRLGIFCHSKYSLRRKLSWPFFHAFKISVFIKIKFTLHIEWKDIALQLCIALETGWDKVFCLLLSSYFTWTGGSDLRQWVTLYYCTIELVLFFFNIVYFIQPFTPFFPDPG